MAGRGPRPVDTDRLAGHGAGKARAAGMRVYTAEPAAQPRLPPRWVADKNGKKKRVAWPEVTRQWWAKWGAEEMSKDWRPTDWDFLMDTALIHARVWGDGDLSMLPELRLRVAKMGATSEDRARLRITYATADNAEKKNNSGSAPRGSARDRRGPLKAV